jgi:hypothetical protein
MKRARGACKEVVTREPGNAIEVAFREDGAVDEAAEADEGDEAEADEGDEAEADLEEVMCADSVVVAETCRAGGTLLLAREARIGLCENTGRPPAEEADGGELGTGVWPLLRI